MSPPAAPYATMTGSGSSYVVFNTTGNPVVQAKVGLSYVSTANAAANRQAENPNWNFSATQSATISPKMAASMGRMTR